MKLVFLDAKTVYEARIDFTDELSVTSAIERSRLVKFKMEYLKVIKSVFDLSSSLYGAYTVGYYTFSDFANMPNIVYADYEEEWMFFHAIQYTNVLRSKYPEDAVAKLSYLGVGNTGSGDTAPKTLQYDFDKKQ